MSARILADTLVVAHLAFLLFVVLGGALVLWRIAIAWLHVPAVLWAACIELSGSICPLTPWENALRVEAGQRGYRGGFVEHYVIPVVYPPGLTHGDQLLLGAMLVAGTVALYAFAWRRARRQRRR
ncbi:MAG: DUF2784 domain-containing protein [Betaproteobacteria bacterium]